MPRTWPSEERDRPDRVRIAKGEWVRCVDSSDQLGKGRGQPLGEPNVSVRPTLWITLDELPDRTCEPSYGTPRRGGQGIGG